MLLYKYFIAIYIVGNYAKINFSILPNNNRIQTHLSLATIFVCQIDVLTEATLMGGSKFRFALLIKGRIPPPLKSVNVALPTVLIFSYQYNIISVGRYGRWYGGS